LKQFKTSFYFLGYNIFKIFTSLFYSKETMRVNLSDEIRQAVQKPGQKMFAAFAGLISVLSIALLISGFIVGRQFSESVIGANQLYLLAILVHGTSCITLFQARNYHKAERYGEYRDWMIASAALGFCNVLLLLEAYHYLYKAALVLGGVNTITYLTFGGMALLFLFALGFISLLRATQRSFITANYLEGFIEGLQTRFANRQRILWRFWVSTYTATLVFYGLCIWYL
jgi:hypothetical protein